MIADKVYLQHILEAVEMIETYIAVDRRRFMQEPMRYDAVIRRLAVIGEATKNLSHELRESHPEIPWRRIAGMRDVLIHGYAGVDLDTVWVVTHRDIPELKRVVEGLLADDT